MKANLHYIYDAYCGWCYGFSPVVQQLADKYPDTLEVEVWSGGMIIDDRVEPIGRMAEYILSSYPRVEAMSGVSFGQPYVELLRKGEDVSNSLLPAKAVKAVKVLFPEKQLAFARAVQRSYFSEGKSLNDPQLYPQIAADLGLPVDALLEAWADPNLEDDARYEFQAVQHMGITGFPALLAAFGKQWYLIARGFRPYSELEPIMEELFTQHPVSAV